MLDFLLCFLVLFFAACFLAGAAAADFASAAAGTSAAITEKVTAEKATAISADKNLLILISFTRDWVRWSCRTRSILCLCVLRGSIYSVDLFTRINFGSPLDTALVAGIRGVTHEALPPGMSHLLIQALRPPIPRWLWIFCIPQTQTPRFGVEFSLPIIALRGDAERGGVLQIPPGQAAANLR